VIYFDIKSSEMKKKKNRKGNKQNKNKRRMLHTRKKALAIYRQGLGPFYAARCGLRLWFPRSASSGGRTGRAQTPIVV